MVTAAITGRGWTAPPVMRQDALWRDFFADHYGHDSRAERIWRRSGVVMRHGVADPRVDDVSQWSTGARMRRFVNEALPLGKAAIADCLDDAGLSPNAVGLIAVVSCTGYATPGLDILLSRDLGMAADTERLSVGHMGCYAALPGLAAVADAAVARDKVGVLLCVELTSLHIQPRSVIPDGIDVQQVVAHALFSDAAAAVVVAPTGDPGALRVVDLIARTDVRSAGLMTWDVTDLGFRMGLSPEVPKVLAEHVREVVTELLGRHGLRIGDVARWAVHPGGPRIIDVVLDHLDVDETTVRDSRAVLADHGNCSSATVLLILDRILAADDLEPEDPVVLMAFGPGLTLYAVLLRAC